MIVILLSFLLLSIPVAATLAALGPGLDKIRQLKFNFK